jgi:hypothetical protein
MHKVLITIIALAFAASASAHDANDSCGKLFWWQVCGVKHHPHIVKAPEIDPASTLAGLTLLAGGLAVIRGRRAREKGQVPL